MVLINHNLVGVLPDLNASLGLHDHIYVPFSLVCCLPLVTIKIYGSFKNHPALSIDRMQDRTSRPATTCVHLATKWFMVGLTVLIQMALTGS